jgi:beta-galactosidase/beta-glucuronidase
VKRRKNKGILYIKKDPKAETYEGEMPLAEYPRPQLKRDSYLCLNGLWDYKISVSEDLPKSYSEKIVVPFPVESPLSGVNHLLTPDEYIYYKKVVFLPENLQKKHIFLHFEGVDQIATVLINGMTIGTHIGGYTSFYYDIAPYLSLSDQSFELVVKVKDLTDSSFHAKGKQTLKPNGLFYTSMSGIYKTVWLEAVDEGYIKKIYIKSLFESGEIAYKVVSDIDKEAILTLEKGEHRIKTNVWGKLKLKDVHPRSYRDPYLYDIKVRFHEDNVETYFGFRKIETRVIDGKPTLFLNGEKLFINGLLDQGYYAYSTYTPRSYAEYENDIKNVKNLGFNTIRKHIKVESEMFYYLCDKLGILLIQDFPNGGESFPFFYVAFPKFSVKLLNKERFLTYKHYGRASLESRKEFVSDGEKIVDQLYGHPSIIIFTIFNEAWGEFDPKENYEQFKKLDDTRLFDTASGWFISRYSDFYSIHAYASPLKKRKDPLDTRPYILSEIGGRSLAIKDHFFYHPIFGHGISLSKRGLTKKYRKLYEGILKRKEEGYLQGVIYTELADCENEANGLYTADRKVLKIDEGTIKELNEKIDSIKFS